MLDNQQITLDSNQLKVQLKDYLENVLQHKFFLQDWSKHERLPVFLAHYYRFFETKYGQTPILIMYTKNAPENTPAEVAKHLNLVRPQFDGIVLYAANGIKSVFRSRLISSGIPFVVPGNQLFIPELAMDLRQYFREARLQKREKLSPSAQLVLFYYILKVKNHYNWTPTDLTKPLRYSIMTLSRAFDELTGAGIASTERHGRKKFLLFYDQGRLLIDKSKTLLICPERRLNHIRWLKKTKVGFPLAGEHALASVSDLNPPSGPPVYAVSRIQMQNLLINKCIEFSEEQYDSDATLASWRYSPEILSQNQIVDPLSLYAQFWDDPDERVSMAAGQLLSQIIW
ncbi:MAG: hypothetical protein OXH65_10835 [Paracoccaceae bacterium]|nr:hypothetical protein [Paracoccaceae bacterium]MDE2675592.1 hypothetical protein [Paracoccaceae bacterium]